MTVSASAAGWLSGYIPDLPTPFDSEGAIDLRTFARLCQRQIEAGVSALVVCETSGEASTLTSIEREAIIRTAVEVAHGHVLVIAGAGSNATSRAVELTKQANAAGADAIISVVPYYNKPTQAGICAHFRAIADSTALPIVLHDIPSRTMRELADGSLVRLAQSPQFVGLRDATGDLARVACSEATAPGRISTAVRRRRDRTRVRCQRRRWLRIDDLECRAGALPRDLHKLQAGTIEAGPAAAGRIAAAGGGPVAGQSSRTEICIEHAWTDAARHAPADRRARRRRQGSDRAKPCGPRGRRSSGRVRRNRRLPCA